MSYPSTDNKINSGNIVSPSNTNPNLNYVNVSRRSSQQSQPLLPYSTSPQSLQRSSNVGNNTSIGRMGRREGSGGGKGGRGVIFTAKTITIKPSVKTRLRDLYCYNPIIKTLLPPVEPITNLLSSLISDHDFICEGTFYNNHCQGAMIVNIVPVNDPAVIGSKGLNFNYRCVIDNCVYDSASNKSSITGNLKITGYSSLTNQPFYYLCINFQDGIVSGIGSIYEDNREAGTITVMETVDGSNNIYRKYIYQFYTQDELGPISTRTNRYDNNNDDTNDNNYIPSVVEMSQANVELLLDPSNNVLFPFIYLTTYIQYDQNRINIFSVQSALNDNQQLISYIDIITSNDGNDINDITFISGSSGDSQYVSEYVGSVPIDNVGVAIVQKQQYIVISQDDDDSDILIRSSIVDSEFGDIIIDRTFSQKPSLMFIKRQMTQTGYQGSLQQDEFYGFNSVAPYRGQTYLGFLTSDATKVDVFYGTDGSCEEVDITNQFTSAITTYISDLHYNLTLSS